MKQKRQRSEQDLSRALIGGGGVEIQGLGWVSGMIIQSTLETCGLAKSLWQTCFDFHTAFGGKDLELMRWQGESNLVSADMQLAAMERSKQRSILVGAALSDPQQTFSYIVQGCKYKWEEGAAHIRKGNFAEGGRSHSFVFGIALSLPSILKIGKQGLALASVGVKEGAKGTTRAASQSVPKQAAPPLGEIGSRFGGIVEEFEQISGRGLAEFSQPVFGVERAELGVSRGVSSEIVRGWESYRLQAEMGETVAKESFLSHGGSFSTASSSNMFNLGPRKPLFTPAFDQIEAFSVKSALDGALYPKHKIPMLVNYLEKRGVYVYGTHGEPRFQIMKSGDLQIYLPENPTVLQVKHELSHWLDFRRLGYEEYAKLSVYQREKMVLDRLKSNRRIWEDLNQFEKDFSLEYVEKIRLGYKPGVRYD